MANGQELVANGPGIIGKWPGISGLWPGIIGKWPSISKWSVESCDAESRWSLHRLVPLRAQVFKALTVNFSPPQKGTVAQDWFDQLLETHLMIYLAYTLYAYTHGYF